MRHLAHFYSSTSLPTIFRCPRRRMRNISVCVFAACCFRCRRQPRNDHRRISSSLNLRISSSSPSSYSQLNVHFSVKQAVKWHFRCRCRCRCRSSRCFVWFGSLGSSGSSGRLAASSCALPNPSLPFPLWPLQKPTSYALQSAKP